MRPAEIERAIEAAEQRREAREAAAPTMGFASYAAYHVERRFHDGKSITEMAEECGVSRTAIRDGGRELIGITAVPVLGSRRFRPSVRERPDRRRKAGAA